MLEPQKLRKLQEYAGILGDQGQAAESEGRNEDAAKAYIKLVDILLLLARETEDHTTWSQYTKQAESYQNRVRSLIPPDQQVGFQQSPPPPKPELKPVTQRPAPAMQPPAEQSSNKQGPLRKILKPFQKADELPVAKPIPAIAERPPISPQPRVSEQDIVISNYQKKLDAAMSENRSLKEKLDSALNEKESISSYYEGQVRELNEKLSDSVPRSEYVSLQLQFSEMITRSEYERLKAEIAERVPKHEYDELLNKLINSVPRDLYLASELKATRLEENLKDTIPHKVLDDIATEVSILTMLATMPIESSESQSREVRRTEHN